MQTIEYSDFLEMVNDETKDYIMGVLKSHLMLKCYTLGVSNDSVSRFLYPYVNSYCNMGAINKSNILKIMANKRVDYDDINKYEGDIAPWINEENLAAIYSTMDLNIAKYPEEVYAITPEDIIFHQFQKARNIYDCFDFSSAVNTQYFSILEEVNEKKHLKLEDETEKDNFSDLDYDDINYLRSTASIFAYLRDNTEKIDVVDPTEDNLCVLATLGGLLKSPTNELRYIYDYLVDHGIDFAAFKKLFKLDFKEEDLNKYDTTMLIGYYFDVDDFECFFENNSCFADDIKQDRAVLTLVLGRFGIEFNELIKLYEHNKFYKDSMDNISNSIENITDNNYDLFNTIFNIYLNIRQSGIELKDQERIAIFIGMLVSNSDYSQFLSHNCVKVEDVVRYLKLDSVNLYGKPSSYSAEDLIPLLRYMPDFQRIDMELLLNKNEFLLGYCEEYKVNYDILNFELVNKKYKPLSREEELARFESLVVPELVGNKVSSLTIYGDQILAYNNVITDEMRKMPQNISFEELTEVLKQLKPIQRPSLIAKLFNKKEELTVDNINKIRSLIDSYVETLRNEIGAYDYFKEYITIYLSKIFEVYKNYHEYGNRIEAEVQLLNPNDIMSYAKILDYNTKLDVARSRERSLEVSIQVNNQELLKICNIIKSHNNTINALTMAKNDILPLIASEATINRGIHSERESMMLSQNLVGLFQSLVDNNIEDTKKNLDLLQTSSLPQDTLDKVNMDVCTYIEQIENKDNGNSRRLKQND